MANPAGESSGEVLRLDFDRRLMVPFRGSVITSDAGLRAYRELDDALGLTTMAGEMLAGARSGWNGRHALVGVGGETARVLTGVPSLSAYEIGRRVFDLHQRHAEAIRDVLKATVKGHSAELVNRSLST
jgi:hypothetical protein